MESNIILKKAKLELNKKNYKDALTLYEEAKLQMPELKKIIDFNITYINNKYLDKTNDHLLQIDIIIPIYNALEDVKRCLNSICKNSKNHNIHIILVNDCSNTETTQFLNSFNKTYNFSTLITNKTNLGYTKSINLGLKQSKSKYVICLNSDTIVTKNWINGLISCMESDSRNGIVGPLSNAATWQSIPYLLDTNKNFIINEIPDGFNIDEFADFIYTYSIRKYPLLPIINGFCFMINRSVIDSIGYMDEINFPIGYGEEVDYCIRTNIAGFKIVVADDTFIYHAKSKSFGHKARKQLSEQGQISLKIKHGQKYFQFRNICRDSNELNLIRIHIQNSLKAHQKLSSSNFLGLKILFILPVRGGSGGVHSIVQEALGMQELGIQAQIAIRKKTLQNYKEIYSDIKEFDKLFVTYNDTTYIDELKNYDVVIATIFKSVIMVKNIIDKYKHIMPAYYIQDYEPLFFKKYENDYNEAYNSYNLIPNALLFAKTNWIIDTVKKEHNVVVYKVNPSIDHALYKPNNHIKDKKLHITAMVRPQTPRRGAARTMRVLHKIYDKYKNKVKINIFGCNNDNNLFLKLDRDFNFKNYEILLRHQVANLLSNSDIFIDLSDYQAFGRTALEAAACGCAIIVPEGCGCSEYAINDINSLIVNTSNEEECFDAISELINDQKKLLDIKRNALLTASKYSIQSAAISEFITIEKGYRSYIMKNY